MISAVLEAFCDVPINYCLSVSACMVAMPSSFLSGAVYGLAVRCSNAGVFVY